MRASSLYYILPVMAGVALSAPAMAKPGTFQTIYTFGANANDGVAPMSALIAKNGVLYGTTFRGGPSGDGTVYAFTPSTATETIITAAMGTFPFAPVLFRNNRLYGTTAAADNGQGNIYSVNLKTGVVANLYTFSRGEDQASPGALVAIGNKLYGTTYNAGNFNDGSVFEFDPATAAYTTIYSFTAGTDGKNPQGLVVKSGQLYGVATGGGSGGAGTVFTINPTTSTLTTLYPFTGAQDGSAPSGIAFHQGTIYGTASFGGANSAGTLFALNPSTQALTTVFAFPGGAGGCTPGGAPAIVGGAIYGITGSCGDSAGQGILYEVALKSRKQTVLHTFSNGNDGVTPIGALLDYNGTLYGTASYGGANNAGTIFEYIP